MARDPKHDNIGSIKRWEEHLAKEKNSGRFQKMLNNSGDNYQGVMRTFMTYLDELAQRGESPDLNEMLSAYMQSRWGKLMNINKILGEIKLVVGEVSKKYTMFQKMNTVIRQQLVNGQLPYIKVDPEHRDEYCRKLADTYFPSGVDTSLSSIPIPPPTKRF